MASRVTLPPKYTSDVRKYTADFTSLLAVGETISSATVTASVFSGTDPTPSAILSGSATYSTPTVTQVITGGVLGVIYELKFVCTTSASQTLVLTGYLVIMQDLT